MVKRTLIALALIIGMQSIAGPGQQIWIWSPAPAIVRQTVTVQKTGYKWVSAGVLELTAYCRSCRICDTTDRTADGTYADYQKRIVAADPSVPFGIHLMIDGMDYVYTVRDRGQAIKGRKLDILMSSHWRARKFGRQIREVWILQPTTTEIELEVPTGATITPQ
jgi:3D (Asp-Asp-Asp) domain-containing protein